MSAKTTRVGVAYAKQYEGRNFFSVVITNPTGPDLYFTLWPNENKQSDNQPDFIVTKKSDAAIREGQGQARPTSTPTPRQSAPPDDFPADDPPF